MPPRFNRKNFETLNFGGWVRVTRLNGHSLPFAAFTGQNRYPSIKEWNGEDYFQEDTIIFKHFTIPNFIFFNLIRVLWHISKNLQYTHKHKHTHTHSLSHSLSHTHTQTLKHTYELQTSKCSTRVRMLFFSSLFSGVPRCVFLKGSPGPSFEQFHICNWANYFTRNEEFNI